MDIKITKSMAIDFLKGTGAFSSYEKDSKLEQKETIEETRDMLKNKFNGNIEEAINFINLNKEKVIKKVNRINGWDL